MNIGPALVSILSTVTLALAVSLPWSAGEIGRLVLPMLPILAVIFWSMARSAPMPATAVLIAGLFTDIVAQAPVGFWTLIALVAALIARVLSRSVLGSALAGRLIVAIMAIAIAMLLGWGLSYLYTMAPPPIAPHLVAGASCVLAYLPIAAALTALARATTPGSDLRFVTGRGDR